MTGVFRLILVTARSLWWLYGMFGVLFRGVLWLVVSRVFGGLRSRVGGIIWLVRRWWGRVLAVRCGLVVVGGLDILASLDGLRRNGEGQNGDNGSLGKTHVVGRCWCCVAIDVLYERR